MGKKILIIEDHSDARRVFSIILCYAGHETSEAKSGSEGIKKTLSEAPDLILMDVSLPDVSGFDLAELSRKTLTPQRFPLLHVPAGPMAIWKRRQRRLELWNS